MEGDTHTPGSPHNELKILFATSLPPLLILLAGLVVTVMMINRVEQHASDQADAVFQARHSSMIHALADYRELDPGTQVFSSRFNAQIPDGVSVRIDTLQTHSKTPVFESSSGHQPQAGSSLRSEISLAGQTWLLSSTPDRPWYLKQISTLTRPVWICGLTITALGALVCGIVALRWRRQTLNNLRIHQEQEIQSRELSNIQTEKRILRRALDDSEQRSRDLVTLSGGIICELDERGLTGYISLQIADLLQKAPADLAGTPFEQLVDPVCLENFRRTLEASRQERQLQRVDLKLLDANDRQVTVTLRVLALQDTLHGFNGYRLSLHPGAQAI